MKNFAKSSNPDFLRGQWYALNRVIEALRSIPDAEPKWALMTKLEAMVAETPKEKP